MEKREVNDAIDVFIRPTKVETLFYFFVISLKLSNSKIKKGYVNIFINFIIIMKKSFKLYV